MASRARRPCLRIGCRQLVTGGYCTEHQPERSYDQRRGSAHERGYDTRWRRARRNYLSEHPLCVHCKDEGLIRAADVVDHIIPHKGDMELFWNMEQWQGLCKRHHDIKTVKEDGGFGNGK